MNYRTRFLCCQLHAWPAPEGLVQTTKTFGERERGRGSRKENENKPYPHPAKPYYPLTSSARAQLARVDSSSDVKQNQRGTGRGVETAAS